MHSHAVAGPRVTAPEPAWIGAPGSCRVGAHVEGPDPLHRPLTRTARPIVPMAAGGTDFELLFCTDVLRLRSLHYGYTDDPRGTIETLDGMRRAQARYTRTLLHWLPRDARRILDVGCGMGDVARAIAATGRRVTAISPDREHGRHFAKRVPRLDFENVRFEDFRTERRFDLILLCESNNYFDPAWALDRAAALLRPGGSLLISGMFKRRDHAGINSDMCFEREYVAAAAGRGFRVARRRDITREVSPTLVFAKRALHEWGMPLARVFGGLWLASSAGIRTAIRMLGINPARGMDRLLAFYGRRLDRAHFARHTAYVRLRLRLAPDPAAG